jgi:hypothetical protein
MVALFMQARPYAVLPIQPFTTKKPDRSYMRSGFFVNDQPIRNGQTINVFFLILYP